MINTAEGIRPAQTGELLGSGKVVLFAVPGAFTPGCSEYHLPGFVTRAADVKEKGVDTIACIAVNDAFVMGAWGEAQGTGDDILMIADGNGEFARALGFDTDLSKFNMGTRARRASLIAENGVVKELNLEQPGKLEVSSAEATLCQL